MPLVAPPPRELLVPLVQAALAEDVGPGDATTLATIPASARAAADIVAHASGVLAGLPLAREAFLSVEPSLGFEADAQDGDALREGMVIARLEGRTRGILTAERTALNFLQHLSGIATAAHSLARRLEGTPTRLLDTRKTIPVLRGLAKYAVRCGGAQNHRMGLYDMILLKENHLASVGDLGRAVEMSRAAYPDLRVEVEVTTLQELDLALAAGADRILLDNFEPSLVSEATARVAAWSRSTGKHRPEIEVSGHITEENARDYAGDGVDFLSSGWITHSAPALDISLDLRPRSEGP